MDRRKAYVISVVLVGMGCILMLLPFFNVAPERNEAVFFAGLLSFLSGFLMKYRGK